MEQKKKGGTDCIRWTEVVICIPGLGCSHLTVLPTWHFLKETEMMCAEKDREITEGVKRGHE